MMEQELILRINPTSGCISVEETTNGIVSYKQITIDSLYDCIKSSLKKDAITSGLLPQNCISFTAGEEGYRSISILHTEDYTDISYYKTVYEHFPLPKLVFNFKLNMGLRVNSCSVGVVHDERLTPDSLMYKYPFSNVSGYKLCTGNNTLPICESLHTLSSLPYFILNLPNNDDMYDKRNNRQNLEYRDLLEHLKDKTPSYYYDSTKPLARWHRSRKFAVLIMGETRSQHFSATMKLQQSCKNHCKERETCRTQTKSSQGWNRTCGCEGSQ